MVFKRLTRIGIQHGISILLLTIVLLIMVWSCNTKSAESSSSPYLNHNDTVKYVGIQTCRTCHESIYRSFIQTGMGSSFDRASRTKSAADFSGHPVVHDPNSDFSYHPYWRGDSMYIMEFRMKGKDTIHQRVEKVSYIIGSGQHTNSHLTEINGYVYQLPLTWYAQKKKWDLPPGFENGRNVRFSREIGFECMSCHNAMPQYVSSSVNKFINIPHGIDCERCHGPGEAHVQRKLAGERIDTANQIDYSIVNPRKLSQDLQIDICQRCHLQGNAVLRNGKDFGDFRPGQTLGDYMDVYMPRYTGKDNAFIMASHAQRLHLSKCFLASEKNNQNALTCITCHNPHISVKVTGKKIFNNACMSCHQTNACKEEPSVRIKSNDNCWGCHMPKSGTIDIPHVTVTDHRIQVPMKKNDQQKLSQFVGIYCINNTNSSERTRMKAYLSYVEKFEGEAASLDTVALALNQLPDADDNTEMRIHLLYLRKDWVQLVKAVAHQKIHSVNDAWIAYRIGQAYQNLNQLPPAEQWYQRAVDLAPDHLEFCNKLGAALIQNGKSTQGITILKASLARNPKQSEAWTNLGFAYVLMNQMPTAMDCYNKAIALDPDLQQALLNKAALCNMNGQKNEAKRLLQQILERDPNNGYVKDLLKSF